MIADPQVDILVPTFRRPAALALTLGTLVGQTYGPFRVVVSDQTENDPAVDRGEILAVARVLRLSGRPVELRRHLPRRGLAEHRRFLLAQVGAPYLLFLDDVVLEPDVVARLVAAIRLEGCGFVGSFVNAPSAVGSTKPADQVPDDVGLDLWDGPVRPERVRPGTDGWDRHRVHFAAHLWHLGQRLGLTRERSRLYKVAWVGGCVLFDTAKLRATGGFDFWADLPERHCGEDVLAQVRVLERYGGAGLAPSGAWHQEVPTTAPDRDVDAPHLLLSPAG